MIVFFFWWREDRLGIRITFCCFKELQNCSDFLKFYFISIFWNTIFRVFVKCYCLVLTSLFQLSWACKIQFAKNNGSVGFRCLHCTRSSFFYDFSANGWSNPDFCWLKPSAPLKISIHNDKPFWRSKRTNKKKSGSLEGRLCNFLL